LTFLIRSGCVTLSFYCDLRIQQLLRLLDYNQMNKRWIIIK